MKRLIPFLAALTLSQAVASAQQNTDTPIDYIAAANKIMGKDIPPEQNAATLLITACDRGHPPYQLPDALYQQLAAPITPPDEDRFLFLEKWITKNKPELKEKYSEDERFEWQNATSRAPWKREAYPIVAQWLDDQNRYLKIVEQAATKPKYFVPLISTEKPPSMLDSLRHRLSTQIMSLQIALSIRANERTGEGDLAGALTDLHTLQQLGRSTAHDLDIGQLLAASTFTNAMRGYRILALMASPDKKTLDSLPTELGPEYAPENMGDVERLYGLDTITQVARKNEQPWLRLLVIDFSDSNKIADDDLRNADLNIVTHAFNQRLDQINAMLALPLAERRIAAQKMTDQEAAAGLPQSLMSGLLTAKQMEPGEQQKLMEAFLKHRPNESRAEYAERVAMLFTGDAATALHFAIVMQRPIAEQRLTAVSIALARYKLDQNEYPPKLEDLVPAYLQTIPLDPFSDQPLKYHQHDNTFTLYSIGMNETDDGGIMDSKIKADDMVVTPEKAVSK